MYGILDVDSYKLSHYLQYPEGTTGLRAYFEARTNGEPIKFFGLQYIIKQSLMTTVTKEMVDEANSLAQEHGLPFPYEGWMRVVNVHKGKIPLRIEAVQEGTVVPSGNVLFTVINTDLELPWMTTWFETVLSRVWYPTTVATRSYQMKKFFQEQINLTSDDPDQLPFKLHDFGSRGVSSAESAGIGGAAHLLNFAGTDTIAGLMTVREFYNFEGMPGFSIPASEHSTMTSWGRDAEVDAMLNMVEQFGKPGAIFACVSDSYDIYNAVTNIWGDELKDKIIESGATLVVRPDSGDPTEMVMFCLQSLDESFGHTVNSKGYKVLNNVRVIQGDGVTPVEIMGIVAAVTEAGYAIDNVNFGMGAGLLQKLDRDTHKFAYKVCEIEVNGIWYPVFKDPVSGTKKSKSGNLDLIKEKGWFKTIDRREFFDIADSLLETVYEDGELLIDLKWEDIR